MRTPRNSLLLGSAASLLALTSACGGNDPRWNPQSLGADARGLVADFNAYTDDVDEPWERSPALVAGEFLRLDRAEATRTRIESETPGEGFGPGTVTVTLAGLLDDSIFAQRYVLRLRRDGESWRLESAEWTQRCQPGRGHDDFSAESCI